MGSKKEKEIQKGMKKTNNKLREGIEEVLTRWFKNPPYPLPEWMSGDFIKGIIDSQLIEIIALIRTQAKKWVGKPISSTELKNDHPDRGRRLMVKHGYNQALKEARQRLKELGYEYSQPVRKKLVFSKKSKRAMGLE